MNKTVKVLLLFAIAITTATCDIVYSMSNVEPLCDTERRLIETFRNYIQVEEERINQLKKFTREYREQHRIFMRDLDWDRLNPLSILKLVKRLTASKWKLEGIINTHNSEEYFANVTKLEGNTKLPSEEDYKQVVLILGMLQGTYLLETASLANGRFKGAKDGPELDTEECLEMGIGLFDRRNFDLALQWLKEAEVRMKKENGESMQMSKLLEYLAYATYEKGDLRQALRLTEELLEIEPTHSGASAHKERIEQELNGQFRKLKLKKLVEPSNEALCRGDVPLDPNVAAKLKCRYVTRNDPFLSIAPFKVEEVHRKPDIWIYHYVLADAEIEILKELAGPQLEKGTIPFRERDDGVREVRVSARISKVAWLFDEKHENVVRINRRIEDMTGLDLKTAEPLHIGYYGIGGHYVQHRDNLAIGDETSFDAIGDRIATVLFYMNDVTQGGATGFPKINVTLWPTKGAAAVWYNIHPNGDSDELVMHLACPVLTGTKWVCTKWIHTNGQEFIRPCPLSRQNGE